jgi:hypothetical protein
MAPAGFLLRLVIAFTPADDGDVFGRLVVFVIQVTRAVRVAYPFHVVGQTHLDAIVVVGNSMRGTRSLRTSRTRRFMSKNFWNAGLIGAVLRTIVPRVLMVGGAGVVATVAFGIVIASRAAAVGKVMGWSVAA